MLYDKTGDKYKRGAGLSIFINGTKTATSPTLTKNKLQIITLNFKTMKQYFVLLFACMALWGCGGQDQIETPPLKIIDRIDFSHVQHPGQLWSPRLAKHTSATLPVCIDQIENQTGRMQNFEKCSRGTGKHSGIFFDDSGRI